MKIFQIGIIIIVNLILQSTLVHFIQIHNVIPNLGLVLAICFAINEEKKNGILIAFAIGILQDILFGRVIGLNALIYILIWYIISVINKSIFRENFVIPIIFTTLGTIFYYIIGIFFIYFLGYELNAITTYGNILLIEVIYNGLISIFVYKYIYRIYKSAKNRY